MEKTEQPNVTNVANIAPKPARPDLSQMAGLLDRLKGNQDNSKAAMAMKPYLERIGALDRELERTHETIRIRVQNRQYRRADDTCLLEFRNALTTALEELAEHQANAVVSSES